VSVRNLKAPLVLLLALAALVLPGTAAANQSHTTSHEHLGTLTVQLEEKGPGELGWSSLDLKLTSCDVVVQPGQVCLFQRIGIETPTILGASCDGSIYHSRLMGLPRVYTGWGSEGEVRSRARSFRSEWKRYGKMQLCWYIPAAGHPGVMQNVARTIFIS
jgi:hypothetical protein